MPSLQFEYDGDEWIIVKNSYGEFEIQGITRVGIPRAVILAIAADIIRDERIATLEQASDAELLNVSERLCRA